MGRGMKAGKRPKQGNASQRQQMAQMQALQEQMEQVQSEIDKMETSASSGGGAVEVRVNGKKEILDIKLQPDVVDPEDIEMLADLLIAATNEAMRKADDAMEQAMGAFKNGLGLPF